MSGTYQEGVFSKFKGFMINPQKRSNTEPQGVPEADDRLPGKLIQFSTISMKNNENQQHIPTLTPTPTPTPTLTPEISRSK